MGEVFTHLEAIPTNHLSWCTPSSLFDVLSNHTQIQIWLNRDQHSKLSLNHPWNQMVTNRQVMAPLKRTLWSRWKPMRKPIKPIPVDHIIRP